jgi:asparagine synthase (glutamine-hydrolysing)
MYAFAIVDGERALLARDPLGIKPLYYCRLQGGRALAFASEIKALLRHPDVPARLNEASLGDLRVFEYLADSRATLFEDIHCLEPGCCLEMTLSSAGLEAREHRFGPSSEPLDPSLTLDAAERRVDELLDAAVRSHQMSDVPICLTISGGLDSTVLSVLLRQQLGDRIVSYVAGDDRDHVDVQQAQQVAHALGFEHRPILFDFEQYLAAMPAAILASESFTDGIPQYLLFRALGRDFRVAFNGEGADELFGGYPEHWWADRYAAQLRQSAKTIALSEHGEIERERVLAEPNLDSDRWMYERLLGSQLTDRHLHPLDKLSMSSSVEVRVPFLDYELVEYVRRLPTGWRINRQLGSAKYILRRAYARRLQTMPAAAGLVDALLREKRGFPDARRASEGRFHRICERVLPEKYFAQHPRRSVLFHAAQAIWCDLFELLFCERRGFPAPDLDVLDFLAARAAQPRSKIAAIAASTA